MLESEADRLAEVQALGSGATLSRDARCYDVIFDNDYLLVGDIEERAPTAHMRASDVACAKLQKGVIVEVFNPFDAARKEYRVKRLEHDGSGMTAVVLQAT